MALSIGIDYNPGDWKSCLAEDGHVVEITTFTDAHSTYGYIERASSVPIIGLSSHLGTSFVLVSHVAPAQFAAQEEEGVQSDLLDFLRLTTKLNLKSYHLPAIKYLPSVPRYRRFKQRHMGTSDKLCAVATLLYRMRQQEAAWPEMRFFYLEAGPTSYTITVIKDGCIVDAISSVSPASDAADAADVELAFWEGLVQDLAGLMAIHHFEDVVIMDRANGYQPLRSSVIERLGDNYQFYLFPHSDSEPEGFETAIGASILAEGLYHPGLAYEVTQHLLSSLPQP